MGIRRAHEGEQVLPTTSRDFGVDKTMARKAKRRSASAGDARRSSYARQTGSPRGTCRRRAGEWAKEAVARGSAEVSRIAITDAPGGIERAVGEIPWDCSDRAAAERQRRGDQGVNTYAAMIVAQEANVSPCWHAPEQVEQTEQFYAWRERHDLAAGGEWVPVQQRKP